MKTYRIDIWTGMTKWDELCETDYRKLAEYMLNNFDTKDEENTGTIVSSDDIELGEIERFHNDYLFDVPFTNLVTASKISEKARKQIIKMLIDLDCI